MEYQIIINDHIGPGYFSQQHVQRLLDGFRGRHVDVKISSLGGDLGHGLDIRRQFADHGDVTAYLSGCVASAATVAAMGARRVVMDSGALFLVHKCSNFIDAWGRYNADEMQQLIDRLTANKRENDRVDVVLANLYAARCGKPVGEMLDILKKGGWLTAEEALSHGFVDEIAEVAPPRNAAAERDAKLAAVNDPFAAAENPETDNAIITNTATMPTTYDFSSAERLLGLENITPDADGEVTVTADQFQRLCDAAAPAPSAETPAPDNSRIEALEARVAALEALPGAVSDEIEDGLADTDDAPISATVLFNSVKTAL